MFRPTRLHRYNARPNSIGAYEGASGQSLAVVAQTVPYEVCLLRDIAEIVDQQHARVRRSIAKYECTNVVVLGDEDTVLRMSFRQQGRIAGIGGPLARIHYVVPDRAQRAHRWRNNIRVGKQPHLLRRHCQPVRVRPLRQARAI